jgi:hypothetical protein
MSNDAEVRARIECLLLDLLRSAAEPEDVAAAVAGSWQRVEMSGEDAIALCVAFAAEARSHDGEWEAMRERFAKASKFMRHDGLCAIIGGYGYCSCGFDEAKAAIVSAVPLFDEGK